MPNIMIVGFPKERAAEIQRQVDVVTERLDCSYDAMTTIVPSLTKYCDKEHNGLGTPYLVVRDTDLGRAVNIAKALNEELCLDVEYERIDGFLVGKSEPS